jgi:hypothetical protein
LDLNSERDFTQVENSMKSTCRTLLFGAFSSN